MLGVRDVCRTMIKYWISNDYELWEIVRYLRIRIRVCVLQTFQFEGVHTGLSVSPMFDVCPFFWRLVGFQGAVHNCLIVHEPEFANTICGCSTEIITPIQIYFIISNSSIPWGLTILSCLEVRHLNLFLYTGDCACEQKSCYRSIYAPALFCKVL